MYFSKLYLIVVLVISLDNVACGMNNKKKHNSEDLWINLYQTETRNSNKLINMTNNEQQQKIKRDKKKTFSDEANKQLLLAVNTDNPDLTCIQLLLEGDDYGFCADVNTKNNNGESPLHLAVHWENKECIRLLLNHNADINANDNDDNTPLHFSVIYCNNNELVQSLLNHGAHVNAKNDSAMTPLHQAIFWGTQENIKPLLDHNADINAKDSTGLTPLHTAASYKKEKSMSLLLNHMKILANNLSYEKVPKLSKNKDYNQQFRTSLLCMKAQQKITNIKIPKFIKFEILSFICCLNNMVNMKNNDGETAWNLGGKKIRNIIENFKKENNLN